MRLEYQQNLRMEQRLLQSPQMIQAMQILQLTTPELLDRIEAELEDNPFLESGPEAADEEDAAGGAAATPGATVEESTSAPSEPEEAAEERPEVEEPPGIGEMEPMVESERPLARARDPEGEGHGDAVGNLAAPDPQSFEAILSEFRVGNATQEEADLAEFILVSLDERGFLEGGIAALAAEAKVPVEALEAVLQRLRALAHPALGARDLQECLLLQLAALPEPEPVASAIVAVHFDDLLANRLPQIAKALDQPLERVRAAVELLATLDSRPLAGWQPDHTMRILPDVVVVAAPDGGYDVSLARDGLPELRLSQGAREALDKARGDKRLHEFLLKKIERARWFLDALEQRRQTLRGISRALVERQREFLDYGPERLAPLKMQEIADTLGIHISTVSRAIRGKYAQTPQGILPLKSFFSGGQRVSGGGERSRVSIQQRIRDIVDAEDKNAPLSDEEIVRILRERDGVKVARRTVTKYRIALAIPPSHLRRSY